MAVGIAQFRVSADRLLSVDLRQLGGERIRRTTPYTGIRRHNVAGHQVRRERGACVCTPAQPRNICTVAAQSPLDNLGYECFAR